MKLTTTVVVASIFVSTVIATPLPFSQGDAESYSNAARDTSALDVEARDPFLPGLALTFAPNLLSGAKKLWKKVRSKKREFMEPDSVFYERSLGDTDDAALSARELEQLEMYFGRALERVVLKRALEEVYEDVFSRDLEYGGGARYYERELYDELD